MREEQQRPTTYSHTTQQNTNMNSLHNMQNLNHDTIARILTCILHAHVANATKPGTSTQKLNIALKQNKLPEVQVPTNPDSRKLLRQTVPPKFMPASLKLQTRKL